MVSCPPVTLRASPSTLQPSASARFPGRLKILSFEPGIHRHVQGENFVIMNNSTTAYLFVFRYPDNEPDPSPEERQRLFEKWRIWIREMKEKEAYLGGDPLEKAPAKVLRTGRSTDGPFAEAKEVVAGYIMVKARSFDEAVQMAHSCPALYLPGRSVEVRQVKPLPL
jgi:hypothetical protein